MRLLPFMESLYEDFVLNIAPLCKGYRTGVKRLPSCQSPLQRCSAQILPSLTVSFRISEVLDRPLNEIFYQVPLIKDYIEEQSLKDLKDLAEKINRDYETITHLSELDEEKLSAEFSKKELIIICDFLGENFDFFFEQN